MITLIDEINLISDVRSDQSEIHLSNADTAEDLEEELNGSDEEFNVKMTARRQLFNSPEPIKNTDPAAKINEKNSISSSTGRKKYYCVFCKSLVLNFARHLVNNHKDKDEVAPLLILDKSDPDRKKLINELRGRGAIIYNTTYGLNKGELIVSRRSRLKTVDESNNYRTCPNCNNYFKRSSLYKHYRSCKTDDSIPARKVLKISEAICNDFKFPVYCCERMKKEILPGMRNDSVSEFIRNDNLIIDYGNYLCTRHKTEKHLNNMIRTKLRQIANLIIIMTKIKPEVDSLASAIRPQNFDIFMTAVNEAAGYENGKYRAPSLATALGPAMKLCAQRLRVLYIKQEKNELKESVDRWLQVYDHEFYHGVGKTALAEVAKKKWNKPRLLPLAQDILKLNKYLLEKCKAAERMLKRKFDFTSWSDLCKVVLMQIIVFNRKRVGEVEKLLLTDFEKKHNIQKDSDVYNNLNPAEKVVSGRYMRMEVRGKLGRPVSLLISVEQINLLNLLLKFRKNAGVSSLNPYVFGRGESGYFEGARCLREAAWNCGASQPHLLTGTRLRKHIATISQAMNFTENEMAILADFMGHDIATHRTFYRLPSEAIHLARISQLLISLEDGTINQFRGKQLSDINVNLDIEELENNADSDDESDKEDDNFTIETLATNLARTCASKIRQKKVKREHLQDKTPPLKRISFKKTWKTPERQLVRKLFGSCIRKEILPTLSECQQVIRNNPILRGRTVQQLKAWVNNEIQRNRKHVNYHT